MIDTLNAKLGEALRSPALAQRMQKEGFDPLVTAPDKTDAMVAAEMTRWAGIVKDAGIEAN